MRFIDSIPALWCKVVFIYKLTILLYVSALIPVVQGHEETSTDTTAVEVGGSHTEEGGYGSVHGRSTLVLQYITI